MKKKLKVLSFKKDVIVNLNDLEMNRLKGGSSQACAVASVIAAVTAFTVVTYNMGEDHSWWTCATYWS
jgi:natural product precursor